MAKTEDDGFDIFRKPQAEQIMDLFGVKYITKFIALADIDISDTSQARKDLVGAVDQARVNEYVARARAKEVAPPLIVKAYTDENGVLRYKIVDGNHRQAMHSILGVPMVPAYIIHRITPEQEKKVQTAVNLHGWALSESERKDSAVDLVLNCGTTVAEAASVTKLSTSKINGAIEVIQFRNRAHSLGVLDKIINSDYFKSNDSRKRALVTKISLDRPFVSAVALSHDANLTGTEVIDLVSSLKNHRSETDQLSFLDLKRDEWAARIDIQADPVDRVATENLMGLFRTFATATKRTAVEYVPNTRTDADDVSVNNIIEFRNFLAEILTAFDVRP